MSKEVKIFVGERQLDLYDGVSVPLNFNISDVSELTKRAGSFSRTIKIPATQNNDIIFGFGNNVKSRFREDGEPLEAGALTQIIRERARVESNGLTIFTGFIKPLGATISKDGCYSEYNVNIFADNNDWTRLFADRDLCDIDWSVFDHTWSEANVNALEALGIASNVQYPLINYGTFNLNGGRAVDLRDRLPAWNLKAGLENMFALDGYTIKSDFFDTTFFKSLYVPTNKSFHELTDEEVDFLLFEAEKDDVPLELFSDSPFSDPEVLTFFKLTDFIESFDNSNSFDELNGEYVATTPGFMDFEAHFDFDSDSVSGLNGGIESHFILRIEIRRNGVLMPGGLYHQQRDVALVGERITIRTEVVPIDAGDVISYHIGISDIVFTETRIPQSGDTELVFTLNDMFVGNMANKQLPEGATLRMGNLITCDVNQLEFIQSLIHLFNLYFYTDLDTNTVCIEPRDDFYLDATTAIDWSDKVDNNKTCEIKYLGDKLKKQTTYKYKTDSEDKFVDHYEEIRDVTLASSIETIDNKFATGKENKENKVFAPTYMDFEPFLGLNQTRIPKIWGDVPDGFDKPAFSNDFCLRLLYFDGTQPTENDNTWNWNGTIRTDYPKFYSIDKTNVTDDLTSLYFGDEVNNVGLFNRFYRNTYNLINRGKKVILNLNLTDVDIINFDFRRIVFIDGCYYYVEKIIDYDTTVKQTTRVELLTLVDLEPIGQSTNTTPQPESIPLSGNFRRGRAQLRSSIDGNIIGGVNVDSGGNEDVIVIGSGISATNDNQTIIGGAMVLSDEVVSDSPLILTGQVLNCDGDLEGRPLLHFDREGNAIIGGGEIYTSCGNRVLFNNDVCDLKPIYKDNINS